MYGSTMSSPNASKVNSRPSGKSSALLRELSDNEDHQEKLLTAQDSVEYPKVA